MKYRNRFKKYGCPQLDNSVINLTQYAPQAFCFADGDEGGEGGDNNSDDNGGETVTMSRADIQTMINDGIAASKNKSNDDKSKEEKGAFDKIEDERKAKDEERSKLSNTRKTVAFDMSFNGFISKNEKSFTINVDKFRESAKGLEGEELERTLSVTAAKDFFRKDENVNLLPERDREYIKTQIIGLADNAIDYRKAFQLIEDALHVKSRVKENGQYRKNSAESNIDNTDTPNVTAYLEKCAAAGKPKSAA